MTSKEFNPVLAKYLTEGWITPEEHEAMDEMQKFVIKRIDLARAYIKRHQNDN